jgi:hypothetical protein
MSATLTDAPPPTPTQQVLSMFGKRLGTTLGVGAIDIPMAFLPPFGEVFDFLSVLFLVGLWLVFIFRVFRIVTSNMNDGGRPPTLRFP